MRVLWLLAVGCGGGPGTCSQGTACNGPCPETADEAAASCDTGEPLTFPCGDQTVVMCGGYTSRLWLFDDRGLVATSVVGEDSPGPTTCGDVGDCGFAD